MKSLVLFCNISRIEVKMRKGFFEKVLLIICMLFGCIVGYGVVQITGTSGETIYNRITRTKDNTLDREKDSVFFSSDDEDLNVTIMPKQEVQENDSVLESLTNELVVKEEWNQKEEIEVTITIKPTITPKIIEKVNAIEEKEIIEPTLLAISMEIQDSELEKLLEDSKEEVEKKQEAVIEEKEVSQSIVEDIEQEERKIEENQINISEILARGIKEKIENPSKEIEKKEKEMKESEEVAEYTREKKTENEEKEIKENTKVLEEVEKGNNVINNSEKIESEQVFTYPTEIFGQTPIVNRSDEYVTYFEFALDLIETVEAEVKARGLSETALFARSEAALALWLTAQVMEEKGSATVGGVSYITDLGNCSSSEKKAIAYLYEQGVLSGYQTAGQTFLPSKDLRTKDGELWMEKIKQCWK